MPNETRRGTENWTRTHPMHTHIQAQARTLTKPHLLVVLAHAQVGDDDGLADLLQRPSIRKELMVHALGDSGEEADGAHGQVVLRARGMAYDH